MIDIHSVALLIESILKDGGLWFERFEHEAVRTSEEAAKLRPEYSIRQGTKSLIVKGKRPNEEKRFIMVVVPGDKQFDKHKLRAETGYTDVRFATPDEVAELTKGILPGGVPPFGNLFDLPVFIDANVFENEKIIFNAGDRRVSMAMYSKDYLAIVKPEVRNIVSLKRVFIGIKKFRRKTTQKT